ncbi:DNA-binding response regulator, OmpR family, contains REC and winged-helix (wHTH) domain [Reichenbachiella faecimaris]|uniref:DNA-binding response regulator, OmpR family, contains REC and winged-helix (WHTH) domain n=1 Tax=Reichenbachiella faecimaris TaxID=692418 RepID=A0A1W2G4R2_REIFA|nr:response regulator transcription factor [Reichenbachiella faecimaris]SMD31657.1 DNA-binding response regulator, OmpR family, contains REC and winged-helix (wHTH) domain [Reichenbachiella faecimaris]
MNILIIEDEPALAESIIKYLNKDGYHCEWVATLNEAFEKIHLYTYDCLLVDITLPGGSGMEVVQRLKKNKSESGIIIISAKNSVDDRIEGLDIGADDYLSKPFDLSELNARIKSVLRRRNFSGHNEIVFKEITILPVERSVKVCGKPLNLTKKEYDLLLYFISNQNRVISKSSIAEHLWGDYMDMADSYDFIYAHLKNLRKKIIALGGDDYIQTVYGVGYKFTQF